MIVERPRTEELALPERSRPDPPHRPWISPPRPRRSAPGRGSRPGPCSPGNRSPPARAFGCRPGPSRGTSATPVSTTAKGRAWATSGLPRAQDALGLVPPRALPAPRAASLPLTPELSVAAPAPVVAPPQPQSPTLRKLGLGPRGARPAIKTPPAGSPAPSPALPLTPEQQARLAAMPAASRDQVLLWLATGDPILVAEARKKLAPLRPCPRGPADASRVVGEDQRAPVLPRPGGIRFGSSSSRSKILFGVLAPL